MTYSITRPKGMKDIAELADAHAVFHPESIYRHTTFNLEKTKETLHLEALDPDMVILICWYEEDGVKEIAGFFIFGLEAPFMDEEVAICQSFYIMPWHRRGLCSQLLLDFGTKVCKDRGVMLAFASSTAGFSDNGVNERAYKMLLKRNGFTELGTFLVWRNTHEQS